MDNNKTERNGNQDILRGAFALSISVIIVKIIGFIYKVPLSHILTDEGMGYYHCAYTVFTFFFMLCTGGIPKAVSIIVTEFDIKGKGSASEKTLNVLLLSAAATGLILTFITFISSEIIADVIGASMASSAIKAIAPSIFFVCVSGVLRGFLNGRKRLVSIAISEVMDGGFKFALGMTFAIVGKRSQLGYTHIAALSILGVSIASFVSSLFLFVCANISKTGEKAEQKGDSLSYKRLFERVIKIALPITLSSAVLSVSGVLDLGLVINRLKSIGFSESDSVRLFGNFTTLAVPLMNLISALTSSVCASSLPELSACHALGQRARFCRAAQTALRLSSFIAVPAAISFFVFPLEILSLLFSDESAVIAAPLLAVLSPAVLFLPLLTVLNTVLEACEKTKLPFISTCVGLVFKTTLLYVLVSSENIGILGAPISTSVCYGISLVVSLFLVRREVGAGIGFFKCVSKSAVAGIFSVGFGKLIYVGITHGEYSAPAFVLCALISVFAYAVFSFLAGKEELIVIADLIKINKKAQKSL